MGAARPPVYLVRCCSLLNCRDALLYPAVTTSHYQETTTDILVSVSPIPIDPRYTNFHNRHSPDIQVSAKSVKRLYTADKLCLRAGLRLDMRCYPAVGAARVLKGNTSPGRSVISGGRSAKPHRPRTPRGETRSEEPEARSAPRDEGASERHPRRPLDQ